VLRQVADPLWQGFPLLPAETARIPWDGPPMLDLNDTADLIEDYLAALRLLEGAADDVDVLVPGHGSIGGADQVHRRIGRDRAYVHALRDAGVSGDPRLGPSAYGKDFLPGVHARQLQGLARRSERDDTPG
jgi:glyoxylase-like metal-dependent hydrolase (beta-lactamase superfamily II)